MLTTAATVVLAQNIGDVDPTAPSGEFGEKINMLMSWLMWGCIFASVAAIMICGATLGYQRMTGGGGDSTGKLVGGLVGAVIIGGAAGLVNGLIL